MLTVGIENESEQTSSSSPPSDGNNTGAIAGGSVGGVVALVIIGGILYWYRRRRTQPAPSKAEPEPSVAANGATLDHPPWPNPELPGGERDSGQNTPIELPIESDTHHDTHHELPLSTVESPRARGYY